MSDDTDSLIKVKANNMQSKEGYIMPSFDALDKLTVDYFCTKDKVRELEEKLAVLEIDNEKNAFMLQEWHGLPSDDLLKLKSYDRAKYKILDDLNLRLRDESKPPVTEEHERAQRKINTQLDDVAFALFKDFKEEGNAHLYEIRPVENRRHSTGSTVMSLSTNNTATPLIFSEKNPLKKSQSEEIGTEFVKEKHIIIKKNKSKENKPKENKPKEYKFITTDPIKAMRRLSSKK